MTRLLGSILLVSTGLAVACAKSDDAGTQPSFIVPVHVENDLTNRADVSIRMLASTGASALIGGAPPGGARTFDYRERNLSGTFRLRASTGDGRTIESRPFTLFPGAAVLWELQRNVVQVVLAETLYDPVY